MRPSNSILQQKQAEADEETGSFFEDLRTRASQSQQRGEVALLAKQTTRAGVLGCEEAGGG